MDRPFSRNATPPAPFSLLPVPPPQPQPTHTTSSQPSTSMDRTDSSASAGYVTAASQPASMHQAALAQQSQSQPQAGAQMQSSQAPRELPNPPNAGRSALEPRADHEGSGRGTGMHDTHFPPLIPATSNASLNSSVPTTTTGGPNPSSTLNTTTGNSSSNPAASQTQNSGDPSNPTAGNPQSPTNPFRQQQQSISLAQTLGIAPPQQQQPQSQQLHAARPPSNASSIGTVGSQLSAGRTAARGLTAESLLEGSLPPTSSSNTQPPTNISGPGNPNITGQNPGQGQNQPTERQNALLSLLSGPLPTPPSQPGSTILHPPSSGLSPPTIVASHNNLQPPPQSQPQAASGTQSGNTGVAPSSIDPSAPGSASATGSAPGMYPSSPGSGMYQPQSYLGSNAGQQGPGSVGSFSPMPLYPLPDSPAGGSGSSQRNLSGLGMAPMNPGDQYSHPGQAGQGQPGGQQQQGQNGQQQQTQQGKLLEQLMSIGDLRGAPSSVPGAQYTSFAADPHLSPGSQQSHQLGVRNPSPPEHRATYSGPPSARDLSLQNPPQAGAGQGQGQTKSMFDFVSPFDALSPVSSAPSSGLPASQPQQVQRKAVPQQRQSLSPPSAGEGGSRPLPVPGQQQQQQSQQVANRSRVTKLDITLPPGAESGRWVRTLKENTTITPIALLKLDSVYHPGTTIGVADFIAYAMTKGRVRLIDRLQGFRALLKLPQPFSSSSSLSDMFVTDTRICATTTDGGLVVWDIPSMESEDPPVHVVLVVPGQYQNSQTAFKAIRPYPDSKSSGDLLGLATSKEVWIVSVQEAVRVAGTTQLTPQQLRSVARVVPVSRESELAAFAFSPLPTPTTSSTTLPPEPTLATVTANSELTFWSLGEIEPRQIWKGVIPGTGKPSSAHFVSTEGLVLGRRQGTVFQLISGLNGRVVEEVRFESGSASSEMEEGGPQGFGHVAYDSRLGALWVANSVRPSLFALRPIISSGSNRPVGFHPPLEFPVPEPMINITLAADVAYRGSGAQGAQSPLHPENAVTAFAVHTGGVHQVQVGREVWEEVVRDAESLSASLGLPGAGASGGESEALADIPDEDGDGGEQDTGVEMEEPVKAMPTAPLVPVGPPRPEVIRQQAAAQAQATQARPPVENRQRQVVSMDSIGPSRPQVDDSGEHSGSSRGWTGTTAVSTGKGKKDKEREKRDKEKEKEEKKETGKEREKHREESLPSALASDPLGAALAREMRRMEDSLQSSVGRILSAEMDRQQKLFETRRAKDQEDEYKREETMLKMISAELTKNTARMVEAAVKHEVQTTVLPALEAIAKSEIRSSVNGQIAKGLGDSMRTTLPNEIEKLLLRPDVSNHIARTFSSAVTPLVEKNVKDTITRSLVPAYQQQTQLMQQALMHEIHTEILNVKKEIVGWQSDVLNDVQTTMNSLEQQFLQLSEQVRNMSIQTRMPSRSQGGTPTHTPGHLRSSGNSIVAMGPPPSLPQLLGQTAQSWQQGSQQPPMAPQYQPGPVYGPPANSQYPPPPGPPTQQQMPPPQQQQQRDQPIQMPQPQQPPAQVLGFSGADWDDAFLTVLTGGETRQLRELLAKCNADLIMPTNGQGPLSQAVILAIITRLSTMVSEMSPEDESFEFTLRWLQRAAIALTPSDRVIAPYVQRVLPSVQQTLNNLNQRFQLLPGGPRLMEMSRTLGQISQTLASKPLIAL